MKTFESYLSENLSLKDYVSGTIKQNSNGYDVDGHVILSVLNLKKIPWKFNIVTGDFDCENNKLTTLENSPKEVGGDFYCRNNNKKFTEKEVRDVCNVKGKVII